MGVSVIGSHKLISALTNAAAGTHALTAIAGLTIGNTLIVVCQPESGTTTVQSITACTDQASNAYTKDFSSPASYTNGEQIRYDVFRGTIVAASTTLTVTSAGGGTYLDLVAYEVASLGTTPYDSAVSAFTSNASSATPSITAATAGALADELYLGLSGNFSNFAETLSTGSSTPSGWVQDQSDNTGGSTIVTGHFIATSIVTPKAAFSLTAAPSVTAILGYTGVSVATGPFATLRVIRQAVNRSFTY